MRQYQLKLHYKNAMGFLATEGPLLAKGPWKIFAKIQKYLPPPLRHRALRMFERAHPKPIRAFRK